MLTRFEVARIIGARALQIAYGAPTLLKLDKEVRSPIDVAKLEFEKGVIPISVKQHA